jgi:hypothetical protein
LNKAYCFILFRIKSSKVEYGSGINVGTWATAIANQTMQSTHV